MTVLSNSTISVVNESGSKHLNSWPKKLNRMMRTIKKWGCRDREGVDNRRSIGVLMAQSMVKENL